jgi:hypothetical protein
MVGLLMPFVAGLSSNAESRKSGFPISPRGAAPALVAVGLHRRKTRRTTQDTSDKSGKSVCESTRWGDEILGCSAMERLAGFFSGSHAVKKPALELLTLAFTAVGVLKPFCSATQHVAYRPRQEIARARWRLLSLQRASVSLPPQPDSLPDSPGLSHLRPRNRHSLILTERALPQVLPVP